MRIREKPLKFSVTEDDGFLAGAKVQKSSYPSMTKSFKDFKLNVNSGVYSSSEITVLMGPNGAGKSTFIKLLAGRETPDIQSDTVIQFESIGYKPQTIKVSKKSEKILVKQYFLDAIGSNFGSNLFITEVIKPLKIDEMYDLTLGSLSGGQLQLLYLAICLGHRDNPTFYLIDEPSAYLDIEKRLIAAKAIKRYILHSKKAAFIVEHDLVMSTYLADQMIVFEGEPGVETTALAPMSYNDGMNIFLKNLDITFRKDPDNFRPRINKKGSVKDTEQRALGNYYML